MFYSLLKQGFSPVFPSKRASRISRSEVPACYLFPFTAFRSKATLRLPGGQPIRNDPGGAEGKKMKALKRGQKKQQDT
jgi:hypothetical protein